MNLPSNLGDFARRATAPNGAGSLSVGSGPGPRRCPVSISTMTAPRMPVRCVR